MRIKRIISLYLFVMLLFTVGYPTVSFSSLSKNEIISNYIISLSDDINDSIEKPEGSILYNSRGEVKLRLLLSPWGELKDVYVSESSENRELDNVCLKAVWMYDKYQPFPEELGDDERWIDVPIISEIMEEQKTYSLISQIESLDIDLEGDTQAQVPISLSIGIEETVDTALENDMAIKIAQDEISFSRLKIREARRALYPAASLNYGETIGKTTLQTQDFTDKEYKVKFEYPLYYGWRLRYAVDQAMSHMKASRENYDKVRQDLMVDVEVAFYSYLAAKVNVKLQEALLDEAEKIFDIAKKRFELELSTKSEFLQVESQLKQVTYQITSAQNDLAMARLTLSQAMNIEEAEDLIDIAADLESFDKLKPIEIDVILQECLELAFENRPDLKAKKHNEEFSRYGRKIAQSMDQLKVDLTGSYGKSGGAYEFESLNMSNDWYLGVKVSKPFGGNTLSTSYTKEETTEKHGQASRTESLSKSAEFAILNNLQSFSEKKSADIALKKATEELRETKKLISKEVKEAYLNYRKGLIQSRTNLAKVGYKEEELKISKARAELNEATLSGLMRAHMELTDEKSYYVEAIGSLYQSLARLNKATGYSLFINDGSFRLAKVRE
ncbi:MAG: TolC family protein [Candidatus Omnitrophica bacterium]|nr:TolC family protein [Candidatus Omnitrophota bacterium]